MPSRISCSAYSHLLIKCATWWGVFVQSLSWYFTVVVLYRPVLSFQDAIIVNLTKEVKKIRAKPHPVVKAQD